MMWGERHRPSRGPGDATGRPARGGTEPDGPAANAGSSAAHLRAAARGPPLAAPLAELPARPGVEQQRDGSAGGAVAVAFTRPAAMWARTGRHAELLRASAVSLLQSPSPSLSAPAPSAAGKGPSSQLARSSSSMLPPSPSVAIREAATRHGRPLAAEHSSAAMPRAEPAPVSSSSSSLSQDPVTRATLQVRAREHMARQSYRYHQRAEDTRAAHVGATQAKRLLAAMLGDGRA